MPMFVHKRSSAPLKLSKSCQKVINTAKMPRKIPPSPKFKSGDFVTYRGTEEGVVDRVKPTTLGYNLYQVTLFSGERVTAARPQLEEYRSLSQIFEEEFDTEVEIDIASSNASSQTQSQPPVTSNDQHDDPSAPQTSVASNVKEQAPPTTTAPPPKKPRFAQLSTESLDDLAQSRLAQGTKKQTTYGIKVFKGKVNE